ncbi:GNAT family N-acetyltransferase [Altererythrobacter sp. MF3-039]|uniref:GNAT family N-acetyltransferase n=1 Tax=Altererythrobacter sp. MF3-039 TaxID=3252901 RepID=UPI00390CB371
MNNSHIRALTRDDLERVSYLVDANAMFPSEMLADMTSPFFDGDETQRWLVFDDGQVDAACYFVPEALAEGVWNLLMIAVDPKRHGAGLGTKLMQAVELQLADEGCRILLVDTSGKDELQRTRKFYDMLGYEREARIRDYWSQGDDKVTFRKVLA